MAVFFKNTEGFEILVFAEIVAFEETVVVEGVGDFTGRAKSGD